MNANVICILGMHRSGTSLVARLSNLFGVCLGAETRLVRPARDNPKGFWEHRGFLKINERLLARAGGSWKQVPAFAPGWHEAPDLDGLKAQAKSIIEDEFGGYELWGWKDPRTSLTLPFWQDLRLPLRYVLCVRRPLAVAQSLASRDGLALEKGVQLWLEYLRRALESTRGRPRTIVVYERMLANCGPELQKLTELFGSPELAADPEKRREAERFIDRALWHNRGSSSSGSPWLSPAEAVYDELERGRPEVGGLIERALEVLEPHVVRVERDEHARWLHELALVKDEIDRVVPRREPLILVDDGQWALSEESLGRQRFGMVERDGAYWGPPADDASAIAELERLRRTGARFLALCAPSFWWLDHYTQFHGYLEEYARCVSRQPKLLVYELT